MKPKTQVQCKKIASNEWNHLPGFNEYLQIDDLYTFFYQEKAKSFLFLGEQHEFWEFLYMDKGNVNLLIDGAGYTISPGELVFFAPSQTHMLWSDENQAPCFLTVSFSMKFEDAQYFANKRFLPDPALKKLLNKLVSLRSELYEEDVFHNIEKLKPDIPMCSHQLLKIALTELLLRLYTNQNTTTDELMPLESTETTPENKIVEALTVYVQQHIREKLSLEGIAGYIPVSKAYLNRLSRKHLGMSVMHYVNMTKLVRARQELRTSDKTVTEVSSDTGFISIYYFSAQFKKYYGISPKKYRESILENSIT